MENHDARLADTKASLLNRAAELRERIERVRADLGRQREPLPKDADDAAIVIENDDVLRGIESAALVELEGIDRALERIKAGTFSRCDDCGAEIEPARLQAVPFATQCTRCARQG